MSTPHQLPAPSAGISLRDILYIVFRHKWKIILGCVLAVVAAVCVPHVSPALVQSEARLYIRYVLDTKAPSQVGDNDSRIRSPDARGNSIIQTELEILTSRDLAQQVADAVGPEKILGKAAAKNSPANNRLAAAALIQNRLAAEVPKDSSVVRLTFQHTDPEVVQPVLKQLIDSYFKKHAQIHAVGAFDEFLREETDQRHSQVAQLADELRKAKAKVGVISLEDRKRFFSEAIDRLEQAAADAEVQLAEHRITASEMAKSLRVLSVVSTNQQAATNYADAVPPERVTEYRRVCGLLDTLDRREQDLLLTYRPSNSLVCEVRAQIQSNEQLKRTLETANPGLLAVRIVQTNAAAAEQAADPRTAFDAEMARVRGLESRAKTLNGQLEDIRKKAAALNEEEGPITDLQRRLSIEETNYSRFAQSLEQSRLDEKLGAGKVSNISTIQEPTPPMPSPSKLMKMMAAVLFGGIAAAFGLPFLIELYLDQSLKRPGEVEAKLGLPLFIAIPRMGLNGNGTARGLLVSRGRLLLPPGTNAGQGAECGVRNPAEQGAQAPETGELKPSNGDQQHDSGSGPSTVDGELPAVDPPAAAPWHARHKMRPFCEALRDRLITYFETNNLTHKPKLVALTSCSEGAGVSTIAAGVAASLSETGDGNVLLVDMSGQGAAHEFYRGDLACGLDAALEAGTRGQALVQDNLYVVTEGPNGDRLPQALPKRFKHLVPRLKASDYDYIIFDMPPVSQISVTPRLARFMDMVLIVAEAEKTDRSILKRAGAILAESKANVGIVLNKGRTYVPRRLLQEL